MVTEKTCTACNETKPLTEFHKHKTGKHGVNSQCKECACARVRNYNDRDNGTRRRAQKDKRLRWKQETVNHYGGKCACCGETELIFLTFDHIDGGGRRHREAEAIGGQMLAWLRRNDHPEGFQVLCWNCNAAKHINGGTCPHQKNVT